MVVREATPPGRGCQRRVAGFRPGGRSQIHILLELLGLKVRPGSCVKEGAGGRRRRRGGHVKRTDVMDVILDGPRVQVPVECLAREIGYTRPLPPPCLEPLDAPLELEDGTEVSLEDDLPAEAVAGSSPDTLP